MVTLFIDGDGCPVKEEVFKVANRYQLPVFVVANTSIYVPPNPRFQAIVVKGTPDAADDWIADHIGPSDVAITTDIPLADRCLQKEAQVVSPTGKPFTHKSIGQALATRELMQGLRLANAITGGPAPFRPTDRSRFLSALDLMIQTARRQEAQKPTDQLIPKEQDLAESAPPPELEASAPD